MTNVNIGIGKLHVSRDPVYLVTLLGSCVAVCLHDSSAHVGGMNHILLPGRADLARFDDAARFGINAMELLINGMLKEGARRSRLTAKVFGGGHIIQSIDEEFAPGSRNVDFTFDFLEAEKIAVINHDTGGSEPRKVYFNTHSGDVYIRKLSTSFINDISRQEKKGLKEASRDVGKPGSISLFDD
jgi:chemotaxis protein CheD